MIKVTDKAAEQIRLSMQKTDSQNMYLRVAAVINPDGSYEYGLGFDTEKDDDIHIESEGIQLIVAPNSRELLEDAVLDFVEIEGGGSQFIFYNPNDPDHKPPK